MLTKYIGICLRGIHVPLYRFPLLVGHARVTEFGSFTANMGAWKDFEVWCLRLYEAGFRV